MSLQATPFIKQFFENVFQIEMNSKKCRKIYLYQFYVRILIYDLHPPMLDFHHLENQTKYREREGFQNKILSLICFL